ncbi:hypothetical protein [Amycolatopsis methanolica]|uniref:HSP18 transcriptional regulator n=1 Tax=Amycolatopsis methanolica 239 TaxID=1068978 RepID=A0A076N6M8_AMYME|nr:hypothetical protein [Amycolatopsis methanolica]AIJ25607.1 HSP18 transcriptional regulator [Amycolatopsis methanolica 239]
MPPYDNLHDALELVEGVLGEATADYDPRRVLAALEVLRALRDTLTVWEPQLIEAAREAGVSWAELAPALGVASRQAAERRYLRLRDAVGSDHTADERVQKTRDRRAEEKAVMQWARENSASLRRLAGQISALKDVPGVGKVRRALAEDDAAALLTPLSGVIQHLDQTYPQLAVEVSLVRDHMDRVRRETQERRQSSRAGSSS